MKKQNRNRPTDTENKLMVAKGEGVEGMGKIKSTIFFNDRNKYIFLY